MIKSYPIYLLAFLLLFSGCSNDLQSNPPYAKITLEQKARNLLFANILCDSDKISSTGKSLDTLIIDSMLCSYGNGMKEICDSAYYNYFDSDLWVKIRDTILLKDKRITFRPSGIQLELDSYDLDPWPYIELAGVWYGEADICCEVLDVKNIDAAKREIDFSLSNYNNKIQFFIKAYE